MNAPVVDRRKNSRKKLLIFFIILVVGLPLWMWVAWLFTPKRKMVVAVIDKTVLNEKRQEHISLTWILNHERFTKNNTQLYNEQKDYFGFFPLKDEKFLLKGLERFNESELQQLTGEADVAYLTDAYGIYRNEWYKVYDDKDRSPVVYGGMSEQDMYYLEQMKAAHKLVIAEFNCIGSPTSDAIRKRFDTTFGVKWTGWVGRYFDSFDTTVNKELPKWVVRNFMAQNNGQWPFKKSGICYDRVDDKIVILENETHLNKDVPHINCDQEGQEHYGLPSRLKYPYWFEIDSIDTKVNHTIATFEVEPNEVGRQELYRNGIPVTFPAITIHNSSDYRFFYFAADFCDNPITMRTSYFNGIRFFDWLFYNTKEHVERSSFFWVIYRPLLTTILNEYYATLPKRN
jgi:hypothetical protein